MIVEWLLEISAGFFEWLGSLFPPVDVPAWLQNPFFGLQPAVEAAAGWGVWINVPVMVACAAFLLTFYGVAFTVRLIRAVAGHLPMIGGNG